MSGKGKLKLLDRWAIQYSDLAIGLEQHCADLSAEELDELESATYAPTETNCWWAVYRVTPMVRDAISVERVKRCRLASADNNYSVNLTEGTGK